MVFGSKSLLFHHFGLKFDDVTVTLSLIALCFQMFLAMYMYLDTIKFSHQILSRLNGIFMVRKIGQLLLSGGFGCRTPQHPLSNFRDNMVAPVSKTFHGQIPQGCAYSQKFGLEQKLSPFTRETGKAFGVWHPSPLAIRG